MKNENQEINERKKGVSTFEEVPHVVGLRFLDLKIIKHKFMNTV